MLKVKLSSALAATGMWALKFCTLLVTLMASRRCENKHVAFHLQIVIATVSTYL
jgi:hypothetical protein